jgi:hypothetical protein
VRAHAFDRQVGLAGIRGAENGPDKAVTGGGHGGNVGTVADKRKREAARLCDFNLF